MDGLRKEPADVDSELESLLREALQRDSRLDADQESAEQQQMKRLITRYQMISLEGYLDQIRKLKAAEKKSSGGSKSARRARRRNSHA